MPSGELLVELRGVTKDYRSLRPLRVEHLTLHQGRSVALMGFDLAMAEVLVNLITGAHLPDTGDVRVFGRATKEITTPDEWVAALDQFGLVSDRAVLVDQFTVEQNLIMPLSLELEDPDAAHRARARTLAEEVGLAGDVLSAATSTLAPPARLRVRLGRALATNPRVLLAEHPNAALAPEDAPAFAADFARIVARRRLASLVLTADRTFASAVADEVLTLEPATGILRAVSGWRRWFA